MTPHSAEAEGAGVVFLTHGESVSSSLASCSFHCEMSLVFQDGSRSQEQDRAEGKQNGLGYSKHKIHNLH